MQTNKSGYPIQKVDGKWIVRDYTASPEPKTRVFTSKQAAERVADEWNRIHG